MIDGEMPGSAPPRMPHATPPKAAGTIGVVNRLPSAARSSVIGLGNCTGRSQQRRPYPGGIRDVEKTDEQQPEEDGAANRDGPGAVIQFATWQYIVAVISAATDRRYPSQGSTRM